MGFLNKIWSMDKSSLIPNMIGKLGPVFEPHLKKHNIAFDDVKAPVRELITNTESFAELAETLSKPEALIEDLVKKGLKKAAADLE